MDSRDTLLGMQLPGPANAQHAASLHSQQLVHWLPQQQQQHPAGHLGVRVQVEAVLLAQPAHPGLEAAPTVNFIMIRPS